MATTPNRQLYGSPQIGYFGTYEEATAAANKASNPSGRNLNLPSGSGNAALSFNQGTDPAQTTTDPYTQFNNVLLQLLQRKQSLGTKRFQEQGLNAQQEQNDRISAQTPSNLIGAAPGVQNAVRSADANAVDPTIEQANKATQTFGEQINSYGDTLTAARGVLQEYQSQQDKKRDDARSVIKDAFTIGGAESLKWLSPDEITALEKAAGYPKGYIHGVSQTLKERELELKKQQKSAAGALTQNQISSTVNQIAGSFDNEPIVKEYNTINTGYNYLKSLGTSPTDDIARVYQFAKIMDPTSAVREGEYKTVQDYSTALLQRFGLNAARVFTNTGFLTDEARRFLTATVEKRLAASTSQYKNVYSEYNKRIDQAKTGKLNSLPDYSNTQFAPTGGTVYKPGDIITKADGTYKVNADGKTATKIK